jgi:hypothetical protein
MNGVKVTVISHQGHVVNIQKENICISGRFKNKIGGFQPGQEWYFCAMSRRIAKFCSATRWYCQLDRRKMLSAAILGSIVRSSVSCTF